MNPEIHCDQCRLRELALREHRADSVYQVGNPAKPQMGHSMYFTTDIPEFGVRRGRIALCSAPIRVLEAYS